MNEHDLREALHRDMAASTPPPPMSATTVLAHARRARMRQRTLWAGAASGLAAVTVAIAATAVASEPQNVGGVPPVAPHAGSKSAEPWPTGPDGKPQEDRTARAGARYEQGVKLLDELVRTVPAGYAVTDRYHQANFDDRVDGVELWSYLADVEITQNAGAGKMIAEVATPGRDLPTEPCQLAQTFWGMQADECEVVDVGTAKVGVVVRPSEWDQRLDQWAAYRHPDGTVVYVGQAKLNFSAAEKRPPLAKLPLTVQQLATLATQPQFRLS